MDHKDKEQLTKLVVGAVLCSAIFVRMNRSARRREAARQEALARIRVGTEAYVRSMQKLETALDEQLETAKFWDIVTRDFEE